MKLRQLQCLCAVVDAGFNISRAANVLHATQPAVSKQLRQFEEELGIDLLQRQAGRPVALTEAGEHTLVWARRAMQCSQNIRQLARNSKGEMGEAIALGTSHSHANYLVLPAIVAFCRRFPSVRVTVLQGTPDEVARLARDGKAAVAVTNEPGDLPRETVAVPFLTSRRLVVAPAAHPFLKEKKLTLEGIAAHPLIIQRSSRPGGPRIVQKFEQAGLTAHIAVQALDADVIKTYVRSGIGIGIIPEFSFSANRDRGLRVLDAGHLFDPAVSVVVLRRQSHMQQGIFQFLTELDSSLEKERLEALVFER
jgi:LysR family cys regulon transcriptional activator